MDKRENASTMSPLLIIKMWKILEFEDVPAAPCLSLATGPLKYTYFHQCLGGTTRDKWDILITNVNQTITTFWVQCNCLTAEIACPTDLADQQHYLETSKKPYCMNCAALSSCLEMMNKMISLFPGANGNLLMEPVDDKSLYYQMMPTDWQHVFLNSGQVITDDNYMLLSIQCFMTFQEEQTNTDAACRHQ